MQCPAFLLSFCAMFSHAKFVVPFYVVTRQITYSFHEHLFTYEPITFLLQLCKAGGKNDLIFFLQNDYFECDRGTNMFITLSYFIRIELSLALN
jgi:hypothetical protein